MIKVHHVRVAGYIRGGVRWPRGTNYFGDEAFRVLTKAQIKAIEHDPAITIEKNVKNASDGATVYSALDLITHVGGAGESGENNKTPEPPAPKVAGKK